MTNSAPINDPLSIPGLARRDFLKVGAGFSLALVLAGTVGCSGSAKAPVAGYAFLARWRGSRFATLNVGGNVLVRLTSSSFYLLPESWPSTGYPGPLEYVFKAVNS